MSGAMSSAAPSAGNMTPQQNLQQRGLLLQSNQPQRTLLGSFTQALGGTLRVNPNNTGIVTGFLVQHSVTISNSGTAAAAVTFGPRSPHCLVTNYNFKDFNQINRVNCTGQQLQQLNTERRNRIFEHGAHGYYGRYNSVATQFAGGTANSKAAQVVNFPTSIPGGGSAVLTWFDYIPLAYNKANDLRGSIFAQTSIGNMLMSITLASSLFAGSGGTNGGGVYTGSTPANVTVSADTITIFQDWLSPQPIGGVYPNPALDLMTVYEINGGIVDQTNIVQGQDKFVNYPTVRSVLATYLEYANPEGTYNPGTDVNYFKLLVNSNNVMQNNTVGSLSMQDRDDIGSDEANGMYIIRSRKTPIQTALEGNVQIVFNPSNVQAGAFLWEMFESFYPLGAVMPGVAAP